ncbi:MAG: CAP domain-containing protein [Zavarzinella sp.]|nr:CAP domain-containing protein [Zavarzinella sp.]
MRRFPIPFLITAWLLGPVAGFAQSAQHEDVEVIETAPPRNPDEKKPDLAAVTKAIVEQTNAFRKSEKRPEVAINAKLVDAARGFAEYMAKTGRYGHTADGSNPGERAAKEKYEYCIVLENIAYAFRSEGFTSEELTKTFVEGWQKSPGHRKNMLDPDVTETGVAVARSEKTGHYFAVQMFGRPKSQAIKFQLANRTEKEVSYKVGDKEFKLPAQYVRTHELCRPAEMTFGEAEAVKPETGSRFAVVEEGGKVRVKKE